MKNIMNFSPKLIENTWRNYCPSGEIVIRPVSPDAVKLSTELGETTITAKDEAIMRTLCLYGFIPLWLINSWHASGNLLQTGTRKIQEWNDIGLVRIESNICGDMVRPTPQLSRAIGVETKSTIIPYGQLYHEVSKIHLYFSVLTGTDEWVNSETHKMFKTVPTFRSKFGISTANLGNEILDESSFKVNPNAFRDRDERWREIQNTENGIMEDVKNGKVLTAEFSNFQYFNIFFKGQNGEPASHFPDLAMPLPRRVVRAGNYTAAIPSSIAYEVECSPKTVGRYVETLRSMYGNLIYSAVIYRTDETRVVELLTKADKILCDETGKKPWSLGPTCRLEIQRLTTPIPTSI